MMLLAQIASQTATQKTLETIQAASSSQPALYLLVVSLVIFMWFQSRDRKEANKNQTDATAALLAYVTSQDHAMQTVLTEVMDRNSEGADKCHKATDAQFAAFVNYRADADRTMVQAITRCSSAVEASQKTNERAVTALDNNTGALVQVVGLVQSILSNKPAVIVQQNAPHSGDT